MTAAIEAAGLAKRYPNGGYGLRGLDVRIEPGELVGLLGPSGSGKTTLFRLLVGALRPTTGHLGVLGQPMERARRGDLRRLRRRLALVYQQHNLVPSVSVVRNVLHGRLGRMPLWRALADLVHLPAADRATVFAVLDDLGIGDKLYRRVDELSGGEQQRVAVARALLDPPELLLADEPIASVDAATATLILDRFQRLNREQGATVLVSLHQADFARRYCPRVLVLAKGALVYDGPPDGYSLTPVLSQKERAPNAGETPLPPTPLSPIGGKGEDAGAGSAGSPLSPYRVGGKGSAPPGAPADPTTPVTLGGPR
jgi:phosphonate transport system ATP-binding protein